jgi:hypothetical protein
MVTQSVRMGNAHAGSLRIRRRQYTNPMSKFVSYKTFQSNKSAKNLENTSEIRPGCTQMDDTKKTSEQNNRDVQKQQSKRYR